MKTVTRNTELRAVIDSWRRRGERIAFVPTMGNLHAGHLSLVQCARSNADRVVVSLYVNPMQFGPTEDFATYPRTFAADQAALEEQDADLLYAPDDREMYPQGFDMLTRVDVKEIGDILCGAFRPGFFVGVATVVAKLFNLVRPDVAVFGKKDFQQLVVIRQLVTDLNWPIEVVGAATVREPDGLAMSSRNQYLTREQRQQAPQLYRTLGRVADQVTSGERDYPQLLDRAGRELAESGFVPDYVSIRRAADLAELRAEDGDLVVLAAAWLGAARLIDNVEISTG